MYHFGRTIKMSPYLVAFAIGNFNTSSREIEVTDGKETRKIVISVVSPNADPSSFEQPLTWACNAVVYFTKAFQCFLPLSKLDLLEIPLSGLGMENFGLATFRTNYLTITDKTVLGIRKRICLLILHEISHMWFGDMVTVRWWSYLFLKEGFARLLEYTVASILYPEHCWWDHFLANHYGPSRLLDSQARRTHAVEQPIHRAIDAEDIFDFISYAKGASVLRMSSDALGTQCFLDALPDLINSHLYHSIETSDLWNCFKRAQSNSSSSDDLPLVDIDSLEIWVKRPGHPSISFNTEIAPSSSEDTKGDLTIHLKQQLHCSAGQEDLFRVAHPLAPFCQDSEGRVCYPVPVVEIKLFFEDGTSTVINKSLNENAASYTLKEVIPAGQSCTVLLNASHRGYFAVQYTVEQWNDIMAILQRCSTTEVLGLLIEMSQHIRTPSDLVASNTLSSHMDRLTEFAKALDNLDVDTCLTKIKASSV